MQKIIKYPFSHMRYASPDISALRTFVFTLYIYYYRAQPDARAQADVRFAHNTSLVYH